MTRFLVATAIVLSAATSGLAAAEESMQVRCLAFSPDGKSLAVAYAGSGAGELIVWDVEKRARRFAKPSLVAMVSVAYSPRGDQLAIGQEAPVVTLVDPATGEVRRQWKARDDNVRSLAFTPDGGQLAASGKGGPVKFWDTATGKLTREIAVDQKDARAMTISADGRWLAVAGGTQNSTSWWDLTAAEPTDRTVAFGSYAGHVAISPDSRWLAAANWAGTIDLIDVATTAPSDKLKIRGAGNAACFSPDGKHLAVATNGRMVEIFSLPHEPAPGVRGEIASLIEKFTDDDYAAREAASRKLAEFGGAAAAQLKAGLDSSLAEVRVRCRRLIERMQSGQFAQRLAGHHGETQWVAFSPDGTRLASGDDAGEVLLWELPSGKEVARLQRGERKP